MLARVPLPRSLLATLVRHWLRSEPTLQNILPGCRPGEPKTQDGNYTHFGKHVCAALPEWPSLLHFVRHSHTLWKPSSAACWYAKKLQNQTHFTLGHANMDNFFFFFPNCQMGLTLGSGPHGSLSKGCPSIPSDGPTWLARRSAQASPLFEQSSLKRESWNGWPMASLTYRKNSRGGHAPQSSSSLWSKASPARGR